MRPLCSRGSWIAILLFLTSPALAADNPAAPAEPPVAPVPPEFDPLRGMDENGRIPSIEIPEDIPNPERWRYIPEGRIKPGNFFERFLVTSFAIPFVFRDSDVGFGGGVGLTDIDFRAQRRREFAGLFTSYTSKGQQSYWGIWRRWLHNVDLPGGGMLQEERSFIGVEGGYQKTLTRRFFGYGPDSDEDDEIRYTDELYQLELEMQMALPKPGSDWIGSISLTAEFHNLSTEELDCDEDIAQEQIGATPALCAAGGWDEVALFKGRTYGIDNRDHEQLGVLGAGIRWDTRDSQRNPYGGVEIGASFDAPLIQGGGAVGARFNLQASGALSVPGIFHSGAEGAEENPPTDTLNLGASLSAKAGTLPFTYHPTLGGSNTLRGYEAGRWRDDAAWHASLEHRVWVIPRGFALTPTIRVERIGFAPFIDVGTVGSDGIDIFQNDVKTSYGVGLRILLERAAPFRLDFAWSDEGFNWTARFGYTF